MPYFFSLYAFKELISPSISYPLLFQDFGASEDGGDKPSKGKKDLNIDVDDEDEDL